MRRAFTLLEVMVAVAIMGLALTVILSAQTGLYSSSGYAQHVSVATGLARCRMSEIEEKLLKLGYPELDQQDEGTCCDTEVQGGFSCSWKILKVQLPNIDMSNSLGGDGGLGSSALGPMATLSQIAMNPGQDAGLSGLASQLQQGATGAGGLAPLAMTLVYPKLKPMLEASIRKVTVTVNWREGLRQRDLTITQYLTHPYRGGIGVGGTDGGLPFSLPGMPGLPGAGGLPGFPGLPGMPGLPGVR